MSGAMNVANALALPVSKPNPGMVLAQLGGPPVAPQPEREMPAVGFLPGELKLDATIAPKVPKDSPRPFAPGEYVRNPDGSWSSEISVTVTDPRLNDGKATVLPSLWIVDGKAYRAKDEDEAVDYAIKSGLPFQSFSSIDDAEKFANDREDAWQKLDNDKPETARSIPALWSAAVEGK